MMGAKPRRNSVSDHPEFVPTLPPTKAARMLAVLTKYPKHFFWEHMYAIPPLVLAFLPVLVGGGLGRQMVLSIDQVDSPQEGLFNNFEELVQKYNNAAGILREGCAEGRGRGWAAGGRDGHAPEIRAGVSCDVCACAGF